MTVSRHNQALYAAADRQIETDKRWDEAVDWLLNSRYTADPDIQAAFWGIVDGKCTRDNAEEWASEGGGTEYR